MIKKILWGGGVVIILILAYLFIYIPLQTTELNESLPASDSTRPTSIASSTDNHSITTTNPNQPVVSDNNTDSTPTEPVSTVSEPAQVIGTAGHPSSGQVRLVTEGNNRYLRYENFSTINGPDLFVYLSSDQQASDFINLGSLKATQGNFNYLIPAEVDLSEYQYALVWCRAFSTLFNSADISSF